MTIDEVMEIVKDKMACDYNISGCDTCGISSCTDKDVIIQLSEWLEELKQLRAEKEKCARWTLEKHLGLDILFCSNCGRDLNCNDYGEYYIKHFKYCPYCGAKMELKGGGGT